jgi:hypothetical protein
MTIPKLEQRHFDALEKALTAALMFNRNYYIALKELPAILRAMQERIAELERFVFSHDLYGLLADIQNGIDSPATCSVANGLIIRVDKLTAQATPPQAPAVPDAELDLYYRGIRDGVKAGRREALEKIYEALGLADYIAERIAEATRNDD